MCSLGSLLDLRNEKCDLFIFYLLAPDIIFVLEFLSTGDRFQLLSLRPIYLLPQVYFLPQYVKQKKENEKKKITACPYVA